MQSLNFISILISIVATLALIEIFKNKIFNILVITLLAYLISALIIFTFGNERLLSVFNIYNIFLRRKIFEFENCLFSITELVFYSFFFKTYHPYRKINSIATSLIICYFILFAIYTTYIIYDSLSLSYITYYSVYLNLFEYSILLIYCITFFYSIIYRPIEAKPIDMYVMNIICSLFFYISVSMPFFIISEKITKTNRLLYNSMYVTHYIILLTSLVVLTITLRKKKQIFYA
jgi:hypothetical protein